jgi:DNA-binding CsgD family transcriptional regulator/tetratricopeptide (TPR) repeat protein
MTADDSHEGTSALLDDLERRAIDACLSGNETASDSLWERAHIESVRVNDPERAARIAFWLVLDLFNRGEWARGNGWLTRAFRVLHPEKDSAAFGLLCVLAARQYLKNGDVDAAEGEADRAVALAHRFGGAELSMFSRLATAQVRARRGLFAEAAALFDEIMIAITVDQVSPVAVGVAYCAVIDGLYEQFDLGRAREWTAAFTHWCTEHPTTLLFRGRCLVHRVETMRMTGDWSDALSEAERACEWSVAHSNRFMYPAGAAYYELGELHRLRGRWAEAETAYRRANECGQSPEPGLTLLEFARGHTQTATASIRRLVSERQPVAARASVLHAAVVILIAASDVATARVAADELARITSAYDAPASRALTTSAVGAVCLAEGDATSALAQLRESWTLWQELRAPYEAANVRILLAQACRQLGDDAAAELELDGARHAFERLSAGPDVARVDAMRQRGQRSRETTLTPRELEVIGLIAEGKTNRTIGEALSISERTVDRHVSNILLKLELPSRSAATAYAYQHRLI